MCSSHSVPRTVPSKMSVLRCAMQSMFVGAALSSTHVQSAWRAGRWSPATSTWPFMTTAGNGCGTFGGSTASSMSCIAGRPTGQPPDSSTFRNPGSLYCETSSSSPMVSNPQMLTVTYASPSISSTHVLPSTSAENMSRSPLQHAGNNSNPSHPSTTPNGRPNSRKNTLQLSLVNNVGSDTVHAYVSGLDGQGRSVMLTAGGSYYHLQSSSSSKPQKIDADIAIPLKGIGETTTITLPDYISSARVWIADGYLKFDVVHTPSGPRLVEPTTNNPDDVNADVNWGFIELNFQSSSGLFANLSFVDFVGLALGLQLQSDSGVQTRCGVPRDAVERMCKLLKSQAESDGQPWDRLCTRGRDGRPLRVVSPSAMISRSPGAFKGFFDGYVREVFQLYATQQLIVDTHATAGLVPCASDGDTISCADDSTTYRRPTSEDIFGCNSGPFVIYESDNDIHKGIVPRICAAFNRATLHLQGGNVQPSLPPTEYYTANTSNWYSAFVHQIELDGRGYAFPYDDVTPRPEESVDGSVSSTDPKGLTIFVGGSACI